jgi:hypothetical protein
LKTEFFSSRAKVKVPVLSTGYVIGLQIFTSDFMT